MCEDGGGGWGCGGRCCWEWAEAEEEVRPNGGGFLGGSGGDALLLLPCGLVELPLFLGEDRGDARGGWEDWVGVSGA